MTNCFNIEYHDGICVLEIANPPVNAASHEVRTAISDTIDATDCDDAVEAILLICSGKTFIAGADIREFGKPPKSPILSDVVFKLQTAKKPWIAAIHGTALGGGLEIALGCHYRIASPGAKLGLPEVNLGLIPGAGGNILLQRCIPQKDAIQMITTGKPISAIDAFNKGILTELVEGDLREKALQFAKQVAGGALPEPLCRRPVVDPMTQEQAIETLDNLKRKSRGQNSPVVALETILAVADLPVSEAISCERKTFETLKVGEQSKALRYIFFAERATSKLDELSSVTPRKVDKIGVIGGGTMGSGIAAGCLLKGMAVTMIEASEEAAGLGSQRVLAILADSEKRGLISSDKHKAFSSAFQTSLDYKALGTTDLVIEAVFEDIEVKKDVFRKLDACTRPDAVLASNTSYLDANEIAECVDDPSRVIGLHFFSPAHIMKLVEIIRTIHVAPDVLATGFDLARKLSKTPVVSGVCDGFIGNRIMSAYRREADYLVEDGASPDQIDEAMRAFGFPIGVFQMQDLAGLDIAWAMRKRQAATRDPSQRYVRIADRLCELGRFGKKTGSGWYDYQQGTPVIDDTVAKIIAEERLSKSIDPKSFTAEEIMARILGAMQSEATLVLDEGIARSGDDIDVVMTSGYSFPRWKGGPMFMLSQTENTNPAQA